MSVALALPNRRVEEWKYSDLAQVLGEAGFGDEAACATVGALPPGIESFVLDGPCRPDWVTAHYGTLRGNPVSAISLAKARGGIALRVPKGRIVDEVLSLEFSGSGHVRALLVLEEGAALTLSERSGTQTRNSGLEIVIGPNARLDHVRLSPACDAVQVEEISVTLARNAVYHAHFANFGARLSRTELEIVVEGEGAEVDLSGVSVLSGERHADITTRVAHEKGRTRSAQLFKKVAGGRARAVYQGKVTVAHGADGSDSRQSAKALLLGKRAEADLKPELEIFADDVKCAHGAAVGDLDADSLFYLRARGLPEKEARHLLIHAFLEDAMAGIANTDLRESVRGAMATALDELTA